MNAEIIPLADGKIAISTPYKAAFISALKAEIPLNSRSWDGIKKIWVIEEAEAEAAVAVVARFYSILDRRIMSDADVENAKIEAEIVEIKNNQAAILAAAAWIEEKIEELDSIISRYSFRSVSRSSIKAAYASDRALLAHALANAALPIEQLAEIQVRGIAATVRYIKIGGRSYR